MNQTGLFKNRLGKNQVLWTLEKGLGDQFTPSVKEAWATVYGLLAGTMKGAMATA